MLYNHQPNLTTLNLWYTHEEYLAYLEREHTESVTARNAWRANEDVRIVALQGQTLPIKPVRCPLPRKPKLAQGQEKADYDARLMEWDEA